MTDQTVAPNLCSVDGCLNKAVMAVNMDMAAAANSGPSRMKPFCSEHAPNYFPASPPPSASVQEAAEKAVDAIWHQPPVTQHAVEIVANAFRDFVPVSEIEKLRDDITLDQEFTNVQGKALLEEVKKKVNALLRRTK